MANSDVKLRRKVRLRKKLGEQDLIPPIPPDTNKSFWMKWWFWLIVLVCAAVITTLIVKSIGSEGISSTDDNTIETGIAGQSMSEEGSFNNENTEETKSDEDLSTEVQPTEQSAEIPSTESSLTEHIPTSTPTQVTTPTESSNVRNISTDIESEAMKVIRGDYGVGQERKDKLGAQYRPIQNRVNQLKREGAF